MATLTELRDGLAKRLATIPGLRTSAVVPDQVNPPVAIVSVDSIVYDQAHARGLDEYTFNVTLVGQRISERSAQAAIDAYLAPSGSKSIKAAIEADRTLGGIAQTTRVTDMTGIAPVTVGDASYITATLTVVVYA